MDAYRRIAFDHLSTDQGLSQTVVGSILQDPQGFMWFGTQDGLNRFDGRQFRVFRSVPDDPTSLSAPTVMAMALDPSGDLWVGTFGGGLNRFMPQTEQVVQFRSVADDPQSLSSDAVSSLFIDPDGTLWIGTSGGGLNRRDPQTGLFRHYQNDPEDGRSLSSNSVTSILRDRRGLLWVATADAGLNRYDPASDGFVHFRNDPENDDSLASDAVQVLYEDRQGVLWVGLVSAGLDRFNRPRGDFSHFRPAPSDPEALAYGHVTALLEDSLGRLWVATDGGGVHLLDRATGQFQRLMHSAEDPDSLVSDQVWSLAEDRSGVLWLGTFGGGVDRYDPRLEKFLLFRSDPARPDGLNNSQVWGFLEDRYGALWVATNGGGLNRFDRQAGTWHHFVHSESDPNSLSHDFVMDVAEDRDGSLWVGTNGGGLDRYDRPTGRFEHYDTNPVVSSVLVDQNGDLWIGTAMGLARLDRATGAFVNFPSDPTDPRSFGGGPVLGLYQTPDGNLWIATWVSGLNLYDYSTGDFKRFQNDPQDPTSLSANTVLSVLQDHSGRLWVGTTAGLNRFNPESGSFIHYHERDGLPNETVYGILEDGQGRLWLSTNRGITRFDPETESFRTYRTRDGLQGLEYNQGAYLQDRQGLMYFGGVSGFNVFAPEEIQDNPFVPPIVITGFSLFNEPQRFGEGLPMALPIHLADEIQLTYQQDFFSFEFSALHFSSPQDNQYAYRLEGFDAGWNQVGERPFAGYTRVPPGDYVFRVIGSNSDGVWNEQGASLRVRISPPFWATWWFRILGWATIVTAVVGGFALRIRSVEARRRQLEEVVEKRTQELRSLMDELRDSRDAAQAANRAKSVFLANMSHEFRTPLNAVLGFSQLMLSSSLPGDRPGGLTPEQYENLEVIVRSGEHLLGLINDVLEMSKIEAGRATLDESPFDLQRMLLGLEEMFDLRAQQKGLSLSTEIAPECPRYVEADAGKLRQILMNLLGNAVKFTQAGGVVLRVGTRILESRETTEVTRPPDVTLCLEVEDTGPGIPPEEQESIFDPFVQSRRGYPDQEGTGLGLSISRQFARLMGGDITLKTELGEGSTFVLSIPVRVMEEADLEEVRPARRAVGLEPGQPVYRLLIVDDKDVNRRLMVRMLSPFGFELREARDGEQAVRIWEEWAPHLIWMDMRMPVMDGYEATRRIKATVKGHATVIVAITASALEEDRTVILSEGCDDYIRKPFREEELLGALTKHLGVRFVYEAALPEADRPSAERRRAGKPTREELGAQLRAIPRTLVAELEKAAVLGDLAQIRAVVSAIEGMDRLLAAHLAGLARDFRHDEILRLVRDSGKDHA